MDVRIFMTPPLRVPDDRAGSHGGANSHGFISFFFRATVGYVQTIDPALTDVRIFMTVTSFPPPTRFAPWICQNRPSPV